MNRIFNLGFTTKPDGHGYGLHGSAIAAGELGGGLAAYSDGPGRGTRFTLLVPRRQKDSGLDATTRKMVAVS